MRERETQVNDKQTPPKKSQRPHLTTSPELPESCRTGDILCAACVLSVSLLHDAKEFAKNAVGGELRTYSAMIEEATRIAFERLSDKAAKAGYVGVYGVTVCTPNIVDGGAEVLVIGTGYK